MRRAVVCRPQPGIRSVVMMLALGILCASLGCTRRFFRNRADQDVDQVLAEKDVVPDWKIEDYHVYPDARARFADPTNPDRPPMPPDDPAARALAPNPQRPKRAGVEYVEGTGYLDLLATWDAENRAQAAAKEPAKAAKPIQPVAGPQEQKKAYEKKGEPTQPPEAIPLPRQEGDDARHPYLITIDQAVELGTINSREFQTAREELYLSALAVTLQRFAFAAHWFFTEEALRNWSGRATPEGHQSNWTLNSNTGFSKLFPTGALLLLKFANTTVIDLTHKFPNDVASVSTLNLDLVQPFLRGGGLAVTLEPLTQSERNLVYQIRNFARFREQFYANITTGSDLSVFNIQPVRLGYLPTLIRQAKLEIDRKNYEDLKNDIKRFEALQEGGDLPPLQVETVRNQVLQSESTVLTDEQDVREAIDALKQQLGLPLDVPLELDDAPLQPVRKQLDRLENVFLEMQEAKSFDPPTDAAKLRPTLKQVMTTARIVQKTKFQKMILPRWTEWEKEKLTAENLDKKLSELAAKRRELLDMKTKAETAGQPWTEKDERRIKDVEGQTDLGEFERALRKYEAQPWTQQKDKLRAQRIRDDLFGDVLHYFELVLGDAQKERLDRTRGLWPRLAPVEVNGVKLIDVDLDPALEQASQTALANRFDLMNARAQLVDSWRQIAVSANSLLGVFNVQYHLTGLSPVSQNQPLAVTGSHMRHQLGLNAELPLTRLPERNQYRARLIDYQRERRDLMLAEDRVTSGIRSEIRQLQVLAQNYRIQQQQVELAYYLRDSSREALLQPPQPGRPLDYTSLTQQYLSNQSNLAQRQNGLYSLWTNYHITRVQLFRDLELMPLDSRGVWLDELANRPIPESSPSAGSDAKPGGAS